MQPGDVVLMSLPQIGGGPFKFRPVLLLTNLPGPYQNVLVCGISTQLHQQVRDWDELIQPGDADFDASGLHDTSIIRLSYLYAEQSKEIAGKIGAIDRARLQRLQKRLGAHLEP